MNMCTSPLFQLKHVTTKLCIFLSSETVIPVTLTAKIKENALRVYLLMLNIRFYNVVILG